MGVVRTGKNVGRRNTPVMWALTRAQATARARARMGTQSGVPTGGRSTNCEKHIPMRHAVRTPPPLIL